MKKVLTAIILLLHQAIFAQVPDFGVHWGNAVKGTLPANFQTTLSYLNSDAVKWIRTEFSWADIHTAPNTFNWYQIPAYVQILVDSGYSIIAMLKNTPSWLTTNNTGNPQLDPYFAPIDTIEWV